MWMSCTSLASRIRGASNGKVLGGLALATALHGAPAEG